MFFLMVYFLFYLSALFLLHKYLCCHGRRKLHTYNHKHTCTHLHTYAITHMSLEWTDRFKHNNSSFSLPLMGLPRLSTVYSYVWSKHHSTINAPVLTHLHIYLKCLLNGQTDMSIIILLSAYSI